ncbi:MAG: aminopeptidase [Roseburia sp.]|nr:aminopeptidase [Roseburia sp.]
MTVLTERYELSRERIAAIAAQQEVSENYKDYFGKMAAFIMRLTEQYTKVGDGFFDQKSGTSLETLRAENRALFEDVLKENYAESYANPDYAFAQLGEGFGRLLSYLYMGLRQAIIYAYEDSLEELVIYMELFVEIYNAFAYAKTEADLSDLPEKAAVPQEGDIRGTLYWFKSDYAELEMRRRVRSEVDADYGIARHIVMESDLTDVRYLYRYGVYVSPETERMAQYLSTLSEERIQTIADTYTEGYRIGFVKGNKDIGKKSVVAVRYRIGFERIVRAAVRNFEKLGLRATFIFEGAPTNRQYYYDHKEDMALFLDKKLVNRRLEAFRAACVSYKELTGSYAGPAVIEVFGEEPFAPEAKKTACALSKEQQKLSAEFQGAMAELNNEYVKKEETSFTIIAFPVPDIGAQFEEIFDETVKLNTLDYTTYERIQATMIDTFNKADYVEIKGMNGNRTDLRVQLYPIADPQKEAIFENCVADVNIPVGEVFTTPVLEGTNGRLHVSRVFLNELEYHNLEIVFTDGKITDYTCTNFADEADNKKYIKTNVLFHYDTLPMGEFAIGTNTTAYMAARRYDIANRFPILIAEKTGPHFAVGDTCYSRSEDIRVYNEDGKEIVAKDNSVSLLRKTDPSKAYFGCHTDITIPYDELGSIIAYDKAGNSYPIIEQGRFVLAGTEALNRPLDA